LGGPPLFFLLFFLWGGGDVSAKANLFCDSKERAEALARCEHCSFAGEATIPAQPPPASIGARRARDGWIVKT